MTGVEALVRAGYGVVFRSVFAKMEPERAHHLAFAVIRVLPKVPFLASTVERYARPPAEDGITTMGIHFPSRFGMAAGFDKDARGIAGLGLLGFGHVEVGTVTARAQPGNERPRLFRLIADRALINRMGFNNHGAVKAAGRLERARRNPGRPVIGVNIGKSRVVSVEDAAEDYRESTRLLAPFADYLAVNVSSPNTPGLRGLQELDQLRPLLAAVHETAGRTPVLVKIAPDLTDDQIDAIAGLAVELGLAGVIATNTTIERNGLTTPDAEVAAMGAGGLSGAPLGERSLAVLRRVRAAVPAGFCVIAVGGVTTEADVQARIDAGATLVQGYTAFLYEGPTWAMRINRLRRRRLRRR
ncbi:MULTISPECIES: quinone-dependent dihydroorotate dehydrogenase [unclassified Curtobacterium]|uniref:quinone-dependent dihydroorotate dehydrogenase n=1 Tax=unclassified Curtobacterium TaxID=257496 RepID=UPI000DA8A9F8|nr:MULTISPECIES: quinone-dependent dihydroorotate dehydrogenase [unclassified Curtobacterium]PZE68936.1 dihydroorotate dehydrogenase (quinone) [Curtobacterium sp. MCBD17_021]WIB27642.1 quinone-dependent dihydroorotate dehydrogenase [Curtobacterium sp. MCSS17_015]